MAKDNIFMNKLMADLPTEIETWAIEKQMQHYCKLYLKYANRLERWCGDDIEEFNDLAETVDVLCEIVMHSIMEQHGYTKDEATELWEKL